MSQYGDLLSFSTDSVLFLATCCGLFIASSRVISLGVCIEVLCHFVSYCLLDRLSP